MNDAKLYEVIRAPRVSEKTARLQEVSNQYVFEVATDATKADIKVAADIAAPAQQALGLDRVAHFDIALQIGEAEEQKDRKEQQPEAQGNAAREDDFRDCDWFCRGLCDGVVRRSRRVELRWQARLRGVWMVANHRGNACADRAVGRRITY